MAPSFGPVRPTCAGRRSGGCCRARMPRALAHTRLGSSSSGWSRTMIDLIEAISDQGPLMLVLDDLHWAEGATLLTVGWAMRRLTAVPLMLVTAVRPAPRSPELIQLLDDAAQLPATFVRLSPLADRDVEVLSEAELGAPLGRSVSEVVRRCGGHPLWVVELLRALASEGRIDRAGGVAELAAGELPGSVRELVTRRLGYMPE